MCWRPVSPTRPGEARACRHGEGSLVKVDVGSVTHPMTAEHFIQWVVVETERDALIHWFHPEEAPEAVFALAEGQTAKPSTPTATSTACGRRHNLV